MDPHLKAILILFSVYAVVGFLPFYWVSIATSRWERLFTGLMLMFYASFVLTGLAIVTGVSDALACNGALEKQTSEQLSGFMRYIIMAGFFFTFLFGGVGTNVFTSGLKTAESVDVKDAVTRIERKLDSLDSKIDEIIRFSIWHWLGGGLLLALGIGLLVWSQVTK